MRTWYSVTCLSCMPIQSREFDTRNEQVAWAASHNKATGHHEVRFERTSDAPTNAPKVNCALCIQLGTQSPATHRVYGTLTCDAHVVCLQIAGAKGYANASDRLHAAAIIAQSTERLGKQED